MEGETFFVTFRKYEAGRPACCRFVEVTVVAKKRSDAVNRAREIVKPIDGLVYEGTD